MTSFDRLGQHIAREQDALRARAGHRAEVRDRIADLPITSRSRRLRRARVWLPVAAAAALALAAAGWFATTAPARAPLRAQDASNGDPIAAGAWIEASGAQPFGLRFSDGTRVQMAPHARARLVSVDAHGAHLLLESGRARLHVVHRPRARWRVSAGPFAVHVIGTRFEVRWDPEHDQFQLDLEQGRVEVAGCLFGQGYEMHSGQHLEASCKRGRFDVSDLGDETAARREGATAASGASPALTTAATPKAPSVASEPERVAAVPHANTRRPRPSARAARSARLGRTHRSGAQALPSDFDAQCASATRAEQLAELADAAHYARDTDREAFAWRLLRRRFPGTSRAALAAFALGRLEFDVHGSFSKAAEWFGTYLKEQPSGALAREARGRLMEASLRAGDTAAARSLAASYLRDYPSGPHAALARSLTAAASP